MSGGTDPFQRRRAGILLHPTSLPGGEGNGDLGPDAYRFVDLLAATGSTVWQMLPISPPGDGNSPYQCISGHAGNVLLVSHDLLLKQGWLAQEDITAANGESPMQHRRAVLARAFERFRRYASSSDREALAGFCEHHRRWLQDFALYASLREVHGEKSWTEWPAPLRDRVPEALAQARRDLVDSIERHRFEQFVLFRQWATLKHYANDRGVLMFGDMPIFSSHDSADVWAHRDCFQLDEQGHPRVVAGVPPDYFSATGQRWGNPLYHWERVEQQGFRWWIERLLTQLELFDLIRIDHFRGFEAYWEIPAWERTAVNGRWVKAPGDAMFDTMRAELGTPPLVAEDLGLITPEVEALRDKYGFPGMKILQFAFDGSPHNPHLPHEYGTHCVAYTGTHDNDTTLGWFSGLPPHQQAYVREYLGSPEDPMPWPLVRCALGSAARMAIIPMQDLLMLGSEGRMNTPSTDKGNWRWRFRWEQLTPDMLPKLHRLIQIYGRN